MNPAPVTVKGEQPWIERRKEREGEWTGQTKEKKKEKRKKRNKNLQQLLYVFVTGVVVQVAQ